MNPFGLIVIFANLVFTCSLATMLATCGYAPKSARNHAAKHAGAERYRTTMVSTGIPVGNGSDEVLVDSDWVRRYREQQKLHGGYSIPEDATIRPEGSKYRVSRVVVEHYSDLVATPQ